jgi:hypothetical protein
MKLELAIVAVTYGFYTAFEQGAYEASWRVHLFAIVAPILILKYVKDLDLRARIFIMTILAWHIIDVLTHAIDDGLKNDQEYQCTSTVSTLKGDETEDSVSNSSLKEKDLTSSFSPQLTDESKLPPDST